MKLRYPNYKDMVHWNSKKFPAILLNSTNVSPYYLVGIAEEGYDIYVAFTNFEQDQIWIEKTHKFLGIEGMYAKSFMQIKDNEEFNKAHKFFIEKGILDGLKDSRKDS
jgi:hypothetical protein